MKRDEVAGEIHVQFTEREYAAARQYLRARKGLAEPTDREIRSCLRATARAGFQLLVDRFSPGETVSPNPVEAMRAGTRCPDCGAKKRDGEFHGCGR